MLSMNRGNYYIKKNLFQYSRGYLAVILRQTWNINLFFYDEVKLLKSHMGLIYNTSQEMTTQTLTHTHTHILFFIKGVYHWDCNVKPESEEVALWFFFFYRDSESV